ncbi:MAG: hypothetical protein J7L34_05050, partial [Thermotogaceae bacterium]|nr:hypothetical protein [Thermotogaceae bacterium]
MKKGLIYGFIIFVIPFLLYGCIASYGKINVVVSISPAEAYEGQSVTITLDAIPPIKLTQFSGGELIVNDHTIKSDSEMPLTVTQILPAGTYTIYGKVITFSDEYKSEAKKLYVKPASEKFKVFLEMTESDIKTGQTANITVNLNEIPEASWTVELYINDNLVKTFSSVPAIYKWEPEKSGNHKIYAILNVMKSQIKSNEIDVKVIDSTPPQIEYITTIPRNVVEENSPVYAFINFDDEVPVTSIMSVLEDATNMEIAVSESTP